MRLSWLLLGFSLALLPLEAMAQGIVGLSPEAPPLYSMRQFGINLSTTDIQVNNNDISIGTGEFPSKLTLTRTYNAIGYPLRNLSSLPIAERAKQYTGFGAGSTHNLLVFFTRDRCDNLNKNGRFISLTAVVFGKSYHFSGGGCIASDSPSIVDNDDEGASLRIIDPNQLISTYELITREGLRVLFSDQAEYHHDQFGGRYANAVEFPNGEFVGFTYAPPSSSARVVRLMTVYNSKGYGLSFSYKTQSGQSSVNDGTVITSVTSFKQDVSGRSNLATVLYVYNQSNHVVISFQDALAQTTRYRFDDNLRLTGIFLAKNQSTRPSTSINYLDSTSQVAAGFTSATGPGAMFYKQPLGDNVRDVDWTVPQSVTDAAGNITYFDFNDITTSAPISVTIRPPNGGFSSYDTMFCLSSPACPLYTYFTRSPSDYSDGNGNRWRYTYDYHGRPVSAISPDGMIVSQTRDASGNIIELRTKARSNSGLADIISTAGYTTCTTDNYKYCNKPTYTVYPNGGRWDYQYDAASGQLAVSLAPADANGLRAVVRYTYVTVAYGPVAVPVMLTSTNVYLLSTSDSCRTSSVVGTNIDFSYICPVASRVRQSYRYSPSSGSVSSSYELIGVTSDADGVAVSTAMTYDSVGNVTSTTNALGRTNFVTYDPLRRKIFEVGSDPDGAGPLKRPIRRHLYDGNGNEFRTERGIGSQTDGSDFVVQKFVRRTFDLNDNLVKSEDVTP